MEKLKRKIFIVLFLLPSIVLFLVFFLAPLAQVVVTSFCQWTLGSPMVFIGLKNYADLFTNDPDFLSALFHTAIWTVVTPAIQAPFAVLAALVLIKKPRGWKFTRNAFVLPNIISSAAIGAIFTSLLDPSYGIVNALIRVFNPNFNVAWLADERTAFVAVSSSWMLFVGTNVLLLMAEIAAIPDSILESARIDGANSLQIDLRIVIPLLRNIIGTITILVTSFAVTEFSEIYILTRGGPGTATLNLGVYLFNTAMLVNNYAKANTVGVIQLIIGMAAVIIINRSFRIGKSDY